MYWNKTKHRNIRGMKLPLHKYNYALQWRHSMAFLPSSLTITLSMNRRKATVINNFSMFQYYLGASHATLCILHQCISWTTMNVKRSLNLQFKKIPASSVRSSTCDQELCHNMWTSISLVMVNSGHHWI